MKRFFLRNLKLRQNLARAFWIVVEAKSRIDLFDSTVPGVCARAQNLPPTSRRPNKINNKKVRNKVRERSKQNDFLTMSAIAKKDEEVPDMKLADITDGQNESGIPAAKFIEDIEGFTQSFSPPASSELLIGAYSDLHAKYKAIEANLGGKRKWWKIEYFNFIKRRSHSSFFFSSISVRTILWRKDPWPGKVAHINTNVTQKEGGWWIGSNKIQLGGQYLCQGRHRLYGWNSQFVAWRKRHAGVYLRRSVGLSH